MDSPPPYCAVALGGSTASHSTLQELRAGLSLFKNAASLPLKPSWSFYGAENNEYDYISDSEDMYPAVAPGIFRHHRRMATPRFLRKVISRVNTHLALRGSGRSSGRRSYTHQSGLMVREGLVRGEVERPVMGPADWTRDWNWVLSLVLCSADRSVNMTGVTASFYFKDLPRRFQVNNPDAWFDKAITDRVESGDILVGDPAENWKYYRCFCHLADDPEWAGWVCTRKESPSGLRESDPLDLLSSPSMTIRKADLDQRTGSGRYKKVMWYRPGVGYANDLDGHPMITWCDGMDGALVAFCSRLIPVRRS